MVTGHINGFKFDLNPVKSFVSTYFTECIQCFEGPFFKFRSQLKSSSEAAIINEQSRALQGIPKTPRELKEQKQTLYDSNYILMVGAFSEG